VLIVIKIDTLIERFSKRPRPINPHYGPRQTTPFRADLIGNLAHLGHGCGNTFSEPRMVINIRADLQSQRAQTRQIDGKPSAVNRASWSPNP